MDIMATLDTHAAIKRLMKHGIKEKQAEEFVNIIKESREAEVSKAVSKEQFMSLEKEVSFMMKNVATKSDLAELKAELLKWYIATTLIIVGLMTGGLGVLVKILKP